MASQVAVLLVLTGALWAARDLLDDLREWKDRHVVIMYSLLSQFREY